MLAAAPVRGVLCALLLWPGALDAAAADRPALLLSDAVVAHTIPGSRPFAAADRDAARLQLFRAGRRAPASLRNGIGMDYRLGHLGGLQFNLYAPRRPRGEVRSWNLNAETPDATAFWLLGGSLGLARDGDDRQDLVFVPQLSLNFDALTAHDRRFQAFVQYAPWRTPPGLSGPDERMPQMAVRLRF